MTNLIYIEVETKVIKTREEIKNTHMFYNAAKKEMETFHCGSIRYNYNDKTKILEAIPEQVFTDKVAYKDNYESINDFVTENIETYNLDNIRYDRGYVIVEAQGSEEQLEDLIEELDTNNYTYTIYDITSKNSRYAPRSS